MADALRFVQAVYCVRTCCLSKDCTNYQLQHANPIFKSIMSENRLVFITGLIQLDDVGGPWWALGIRSFRCIFSTPSMTIVERCEYLRICCHWVKPYRGRTGSNKLQPCRWCSKTQPIHVLHGWGQTPPTWFFSTTCAGHLSRRKRDLFHGMNSSIFLKVLK